MKEERFRQLFAAFGTLTDCSLKFTKDGKFRKFGFIGFKSEEEARTALNHFNKSFIDTSRITVSQLRPAGGNWHHFLIFPSTLQPGAWLLSDCAVFGLPHWFSDFHAYGCPGELVETVSASVWG